MIVITDVIVLNDVYSLVYISNKQHSKYDKIGKTMATMILREGKLLLATVHVEKQKKIVIDLYIHNKDLYRLFFYT